MSEQIEITVIEGARKTNCRLTLTACLRDLPGRRTVHHAVDENGKSLLIKRFIHPGKAAKDACREWRAGKALTERAMPTPRPLFLGRCGESEWVVAAEYLDDAQSLGTALEDGRAQDRRDLLQQLLEVVHQGHCSGAVQTDLHLENFLVRDGKLHCIDAASFRFFAKAARPRVCRANLALLRANVALPWQRDLESAWLALPHLPAIADRLYRKVLAKRIRSFAKKCERDCSAFERIERAGLTLWRTRDCPLWIGEWLELSRDQLRERGAVLKDGKTCLVVKCAPDEGHWIIKRRSYAKLPMVIKRRSRARRSWIAGHVLRLLGLATPKPWACWECREQGMLVADGLLMSYDGGTPLHEWVREPDHSPELRQKVGDHFEALFDQLAMINASHGDTKASNFRIGPNGNVGVIDLDSFTFHRRNARKAERMAQRDRLRFEKNGVKYPQGNDVFGRVT